MYLALVKLVWVYDQLTGKKDTGHLFNERQDFELGLIFITFCREHQRHRQVLEDKVRRGVSKYVEWICWQDSSTRVPCETYEVDCYLHILSTVGFINGIRTNCVSDVSIQWYFQRREELYHLLMSLQLFTIYIYTSWSLLSSVYLPDILTSLLICTHCSYYAIFHLNSWSPPSSPLHSTIPFFLTIKNARCISGYLCDRCSVDLSHDSVNPAHVPSSIWYYRCYRPDHKKKR